MNIYRMKSVYLQENDYVYTLSLLFVWLFGQK